MKEKKSLDTLHKISSLLLALVSIFGIFVPIVGFSFDYGYMVVFGIDSNLFPRSLWDLWKHSFTIFEAFSFASFKYVGDTLILIVVILVWAAWLLLFLLLAAYFLRKTRLRRLIKKPDMKFLSGRLEVFKPALNFFRILLRTVIVVVGIVILFLIVYIPFMYGSNQAMSHGFEYKQLGCIADERTRWMNCVDYSNLNNPQAKSWRGLLVAASSTHIAIFDGNSVSVIPRTPEYVLTKEYKIGGE